MHSLMTKCPILENNGSFTRSRGTESTVHYFLRLFTYLNYTLHLLPILQFLSCCLTLLSFISVFQVCILEGFYGHFS